jgi:hypothetical protein
MNQLKGYLVYAEQAPYSWWLKLVLGGVPLVTLALGIWALAEDIFVAAIMFGVTIFDGLLFYFIMPRKYQIYSDRLVIVLGPPFNMTVPFADIKEVRAASRDYAVIYTGVRFATSTKHVLEIRRRKGTSTVISPDSEMFLEQLNQARKIYG